MKKHVLDFGFPAIKGEGKPMHPDYMGIGFTGGIGLTDNQYHAQLKAYAECYGIEHAEDVSCTRPHLLEKVIEDVAII